KCQVYILRTFCSPYITILTPGPHLVLTPALHTLKMRLPGPRRLAGPQYRPDYRHIGIVSDTREDHGDGRFKPSIGTRHQCSRHRHPRQPRQSNIQGGFSFPFWGGTGEVNYEPMSWDTDPSPPHPPPHPLPPTPSSRYASQRTSVAEAKNTTSKEVEEDISFLQLEWSRRTRSSV
ncbi:Cuticle protein, partial [Homarus americanus]